MARTFHLFTFLYSVAPLFAIRYLLFPICYLLICGLFLSRGFAQNTVQWCLPDSDKASLGSTAINALTFSADGSRLAVASGNGIALYDTHTGEGLTLLPLLMADVTALALSPAREKDGGQTIASAGEDATVRLWDARTGEHRADFIGHTDPVVSLKFSSDGNILASGSFKEIRLWRLTLDGVSRVTVLQGHRDMVTTLAFSPDSKTLASTSFYGTILLWDVETGQLRYSLPAHTGSIQTLAFSPDNEILASGGYWNPDAEGTISLWSPRTGQLLATFENHTVPVFALAFSPDIQGAYSRTLASAGWANAIHIWNPYTGALQAIFEGDAAPVIALAFLLDTHGNYSEAFASVSLDGTIEVRSLESVETSNQQRNARMANVIQGMDFVYSQTKSHGDVNSDGVVNILDLAFVASRFGENSPDLNGDGIVNILDLVLVAQYITE